MAGCELCRAPLSCFVAYQVHYNGIQVSSFGEEIRSGVGHATAVVHFSVLANDSIGCAVSAPVCKSMKSFHKTQDGTYTSSYPW